jgi:hypothetical protein
MNRRTRWTRQAQQQDKRVKTQTAMWRRAQEIDRQEQTRADAYQKPTDEVDG